MKTKYLKGYRLVVDRFGTIELWSLNHPKDTEEFYMLKYIDYHPKLKEDNYLINELNRLAQIDEMWFSIYITGKITYDPAQDYITSYNNITSLKIEKIEIENEKEIGQP
jgi:hypothetical protein